jgi:hypothetical protein
LPLKSAEKGLAKCALIALAIASGCCVRRDRKAALKSRKKTAERYGRVHNIITDKLRFYGAGLKETDSADRQGADRWLNKRGGEEFTPAI